MRIPQKHALGLDPRVDTILRLEYALVINGIIFFRLTGFHLAEKCSRH
jgi:hypothetical protein